MLRRLLGRLRRPPTLPSRQAYALWAPHYPPQAHNPLMELEQRLMLDLMPGLRGRRVLDLACGTGRYGLLARQQGAAAVLGLDDSVDMLAHAPLAPVVCGAMMALPLQAAAFDVVLCGLAVGHLPELRPLFAEAARVLRPGGRLLVSDFHPVLFFCGGQRTLRGPDGRVYAVEHYPHLYADYHAAAQAWGLVVEQVAEAPLPDAAAPPALRGRPAVIVLRFVLAAQSDSMGAVSSSSGARG